MSQRDKILELLEEREDKGATNRELNDIAFRYGARLHELRQDGYKIRTKQVKKGYFKFILESEEE